LEEKTMHLLRQADEMIKKNKKETAEYILLHSLDFEVTCEQYRKLGKLYSVHSNRLEEALDAYRKALSICSQSAELKIMIGEILFRMNRRHEANLQLTEALQEKSSSLHYRAYYLLAVLFQNWNRPERSVRYLNLSLKCREDYLPAVKMLNYLKNKYLPSKAV